MTMLPPILDDPVRHLLMRLYRPGPRILIGLAGVPGSGKSTLAAHLADAVNNLAGPNTMVALGMDGFHLPQAALRRMPDPKAAFARRGAPWTFDVPALAARLQAVREEAGRAEVAWPEFQHEIGDPVEAAQTVGAATRLVLVEGLYLLHPDDGWAEVSQSFDERWFLDTSLEVSLARLTARHVTAWGLTRAEAERRIAANDRLNAEIVLESRVVADWRLLTKEA